MAKITVSKLKCDSTSEDMWRHMKAYTQNLLVLKVATGPKLCTEEQIVHWPKQLKTFPQGTEP